MSTNFEDLVGRGATGAKPAAGVPGRLYYDTTLGQWERDTGVVWEVCEPAAGGSDAGDITYTPAVESDWDADADPGDLDDAINQLAERVTDLEEAGGGGGGGDVATDAIWDAAGDIVQGTGADAAARLPIGTAYQLLRVNAGATALEYVSAGRVLISEQTPTETGTVTFDSIPGGFKSLYLEWFGRSTVNATAEGGSCFLNNDTTATNYRRQRTTGAGTTASATTGDDAGAFSFVGATGQANSAGYGYLKIIGYSGTTFYKCILGQDWYRTAATTNTMHSFVIEWENTAAVTRIDMVLGSGDYVAGTTFRLYGEY